MMAIGEVGKTTSTQARPLRPSDLGHCLALGLRDFAACPQFGLFFAAFYVIPGLLLVWAWQAWNVGSWAILAGSGFPLIAPFAAVGLYEVSRRREAGLPISWGAVLGALKGRGDEQLPLMGGILFVAFSFWLIIAHTIFGIFLAESGMESDVIGFLGTTAGVAMLAFGGATGAVLAWVLFICTVTSLPMLLDREVDFITAIIASVRHVRRNQGVMLLWAMLVAGAMLAAMLPLFLGLLVVLPVLGHATWHLYRRLEG